MFWFYFTIKYYPYIQFYMNVGILLMWKHTCMSSPPGFCWDPCCSCFTCFFFSLCPIMCLYVVSSWLWCRYDFSKKRCSVCLYLQLFIGGLASYLRYLWLLAYSGVQYIWCCVFILFVVDLCTLCSHILWIAPSVFSNVYLPQFLFYLYSILELYRQYGSFFLHFIVYSWGHIDHYSIF